VKTASEITNFKYDYNEIEYNEETDMHTLVQIQFPLNIQQDYSGEDAYETVIKFSKGDNLSKLNNLNKLSKTISRSKASSVAIAKNKPKTRKQKNRDSRIKQKLSGSNSSSDADSSSATTPVSPFEVTKSTVEIESSSSE
jgi:hypothetical protein